MIRHTAAADLLLNRLTLWVFLMESFGFSEDDVDHFAHLIYHTRRGAVVRLLLEDRPMPIPISAIEHCFWQAAFHAAGSWKR